MHIKNSIIIMVCGIAIPLPSYAHKFSVPDIDLTILVILLLMAVVAYFSASIVTLKRKILYYKNMSLTDELTNIMNRRAIIQKAKSDLSLVHRSKQPYSIAVCDLDHFKDINDRYGHNIGDKILKQTAHILHNSIREYDAVGRIGGEEFVILMPNTTTNDALILLNRVKTNLATANIMKAGSVTISIGVTEVLPTDMKFSSMYKRADRALYDAKKNGRNRVEVVKAF